MSLPESWVQVRLTDVCELNPRLRAEDRPNDDTTVTFVPMSAVDEYGGIINKPETRTFTEVAKGYTSFRERDVLFAKVTPCMENGKAAIARNLENGLGFGSTEFHVLRPSEAVLPEYVFSFVRQKAFRDRAASALVGTGGLQRVPPDFLSRVKIPLPTLPEQQRIVDVLRQTEVVAKLRYDFDELLARTKRQLFVEMFGDPATNPKQLKKKKIGKLVKMKSGDFLPAKDMAGGGLFKVYGGNGVNGVHDRYMFEESKVVIGRVGAYCGAVHFTDPKSWVTDNALYISEKFEYLNDQYLSAALDLANLNRYAGQAGQPLISAGRINPVEIMVPSEAEQDAYAYAVDLLQEIVFQRNKAEQQLSELHTQVTQQAFLGEITEAWRNQNSAEIATAIAIRDALLHKHGTKVSLTATAITSVTKQADLTVHPARHWLLAELSEFQRRVLSGFNGYELHPVFTEDTSDFAMFCDSDAVRDALGRLEWSPNQVGRALGVLADLGLIAQVSILRRDVATNSDTFHKAFRPLREDERTRLADIATLKRMSHYGDVVNVVYRFRAFLDRETSVRAGADELFQVTLLEDDDGHSRTDLIDHGRQYVDLDALRDDLAKRLGVAPNLVAVEEIA